MRKFVQHIMLDAQTTMIRTADSYIVRDISSGTVDTAQGEFIEFCFQQKLPQFSSIRYGSHVFAALSSTTEHSVLAGTMLVLFDRRRRAILSTLELPEQATSVCFVRGYIAVSFVSGEVLLLQTSDFAQQVQFRLPSTARQLFSYTNALIALLDSGEVVFIENFQATRVIKTDKPLKQISIAPYLQESELRILGLAWDGQVYYIDERGSRMIPTVHRLVSIDTYVVGILTGMDCEGNIFLIDVGTQ